MDARQWLIATTPRNFVRKRMKCCNDFTMSVQASRFHYCEPRQDRIDGAYKSVEVGYPNKKEPLLDKYRSVDSGIYPYVPVKVIDEIIKKHGGIRELEAL